jgi:hypothetical protein
MSELEPKDDELIRPRMASEGGYFMQCCSCGLVHRLDFSLNSNVGPADPREYRLELRVYRDEEKTLAARGGIADWWFGGKRFRELKAKRKGKPISF